MEALSDKRILDSWTKNVSPWAKAIQEKKIESRNLVTDQAIVNLISSFHSNTVLDIGCGEGWLVRELSSLGLSVTGIDAVKGLVDIAIEHGKGVFHVLEYEKISSNTLSEKYDIAVCNFSLLGKESVEHIFNAIPEILNDGGHFVIQTLHPHASCDDAPYVDGWREGSWNGFSKEFVDPAPWYFRTLESWCDLYIKSGLKLNKIEESVNPHTGKVTSLLMVGSVAT
ncbi:MAG: methyltransferase domain-containing protein [Pseudomonadales bacterium]|nr:methyltransferase domain-containing protein [Pseudomonadales bacterium]